MHKLNAVDFSVSLKPRYTFWSGLIGGMFLALAYFGTDQSQVQRYISGASLRESRLGLMFNAVCKIPMQLFILLLGVMLFVFYQIQAAADRFQSTGVECAIASMMRTIILLALERQFAEIHVEKEQLIRGWLKAKHTAAGNAKRAIRC